MSESWPIVAGVVLLVLLIGVGAFVLSRRRTAPGRHAANGRPSRDSFRPAEEEPPRKRCAVIINPTKFEDLESVKRQLSEGSSRAGWADPLVIETTEDDPGYGQTRTALAERVDLVCALGGDGTVRAVGQVLAGESTPMGLLPGGTGNLLGRNLGVPLELDKAVQVALTGRNRRIDIGWLTIDPPNVEPVEVPDDLEVDSDANDQHAFLVMAGVGLDAAVMDSTSEELKAKVGWMAYAASGAKSLVGNSRFRATLHLDGRQQVHRRAATIIVGNCGQLTGGIELMPDARVDDGILDVVAITPKGLAGWASVAINLATPGNRRHPRLERYTGQSLVLELDEPQMVEIDGDVIGEATRLRFDVRPQALIVRTPTA